MDKNGGSVSSLKGIFVEGELLIASVQPTTCQAAGGPPDKHVQTNVAHKMTHKLVVGKLRLCPRAQYPKGVKVEKGESCH